MHRREQRPHRRRACPCTACCSRLCSAFAATVVPPCSPPSVPPLLDRPQRRPGVLGCGSIHHSPPLRLPPIPLNELNGLSFSPTKTHTQFTITTSSSSSSSSSSSTKTPNNLKRPATTVTTTLTTTPSLGCKMNPASPTHFDQPASPTPPVEPFIIGVTGASASGKTTVCRKIIDGLADQRCVLVSVDWFYHGLPAHGDPSSYNFDHPSAFDFDALLDTLAQMRRRKPVRVATYNFALHKRDPAKTADLNVADVIIVEGILTFYDRRIRDMMHMKVFVDEDADICLSRRIERDVAARGRSVSSILKQYKRFVKPAFEEFILPTKRYADIIMPRGAENIVLIDMIIKHIALKIRQDDLRKLYPGLIVMADSFQTRGLHTIIRDEHASRDDFIFYSNRLMRLLVEEGLGLLPFRRKSVRTPTGTTYYGVGFVAGIAAVSLLPDGATMESSIRAVCNTVRIGKMAVSRDDPQTQAQAQAKTNDHQYHNQQNHNSNNNNNHNSNNNKTNTNNNNNNNNNPLDPPLYDRPMRVTYENLPADIADRFVLVLTPVLNSGSSCEHAIARLVEVGCREDRIVLLSLIIAPQAVVRICSRFPNIKLVVSSVDKGLDDKGRVCPGIGDFATRYLGND